MSRINKRNITSTTNRSVSTSNIASGSRLSTGNNMRVVLATRD